MTVAGSIAAIVLGATVGILGRLLIRGRRAMPVWLLAAVGVVAAFAGTGLCNLAGLEHQGWNLWKALFQVGAAIFAVFLVALCWPADTRRR